ncbi:RluA family pseudouridine synthase [Oscillospiraceae bacterium OttesenSCG-928-F05]|nr:RluA family pseudouridine synthase [Oscillospiraceae bacterium OttesenSCG-928-F05]
MREPETIFLSAMAHNAGERVDKFIASMTGLSRNAVQDLIGREYVRLGGVPVRKNARVLAGACYEVSRPPSVPAELEAVDIPLDVVYEDTDLIVINKPRGLVVHPAAGHRSDTLVNALLYHCGGSLSGIGGVERPGIVHRLDKMTSGLMAAAKNDDAHRSLAEQIATRSFSRVYEAVVVGGPKEDAGRIDAPIGRSQRDRKKMAVTTHGGKNAATNWRVLRRYVGYTHIECRLETGRTHQIRVHMAHTGHPVAGDTEYGGRRDEFGLGGQCLHARTVAFTHPRTGEALQFSGDLPDYFERVLTSLQRRG